MHDYERDADVVDRDPKLRALIDRAASLTDDEVGEVLRRLGIERETEERYGRAVRAMLGDTSATGHTAPMRTQ
jgi:hypothetical protein